MSRQRIRIPNNSATAPLQVAGIDIKPGGYADFDLDQVPAIYRGIGTLLNDEADDDPFMEELVKRGAVLGSVNPLLGGGAILQSGGKNVLSLMYADVTASKTLTLSDAGQVLKCNSASAIVLTIPNDATGMWEGNDGIAAYQAGAGAVSFAAGSGVTLRGTAPTAAQYSTQGVMRVGANEWAYL